jgi:hypothetical protein
MRSENDDEDDEMFSDSEDEHHAKREVNRKCLVENFKRGVFRGCAKFVSRRKLWDFNLVNDNTLTFSFVVSVSS